jgi:putative (di)nucleoside polyphosphate hydrolase
MWKNQAHRESQDDSMTDFIDASGFRANVGIVLIRGKGDVFLGGRTGGRGWQFPQGGIGRDEDPEEGMFRELKEEIGLEPGDVRIIASTRGWLRYRLPAQYLRRNAKQTCIGQKQRWFMLEMTSGEDRFRFDTTATPEFESWRWVDYWAPVREVIYFKRAVYARALDELGRHAFAGGPPPLPAWWEEEKTLRNLARRRESQPEPQ